MKPLTNKQKQILQDLQQFGRLEVGSQVEQRTADALVRKGYCEFFMYSAWADKPAYQYIRLIENETNAALV
jgi:hypothetical protein